MCGICCIVYSKDLEANVGQEHINKNSRLFNRGPDAIGCQKYTLSELHSALFCGCVLHFRGSLTPQPITDQTGNVMLWNGEIFGGLQVGKSENDGAMLLKKLSLCSDDLDILDVFATIQGPWAFIFWQESRRKLWFGRDIFGRRCLLWNKPSSLQNLVLSSVRLHPYEMTEVPANGVYSIDFNEQSNYTTNITRYPWQFSSPNGKRAFHIDSTAYEDQGSSFDFPITLGQYSIWPGIQEFNRSLPGQGLEKCAGESKRTDITDKKPNSNEVETGQVKEQSDCVSNNGARLKNGEDKNVLVNINSLQMFGSERMQSLSDELIAVLGQSVKVRVEALPDLCTVCFHRQIGRSTSTMVVEQPVSAVGNHDLHSGSDANCQVSDSEMTRTNSKIEVAEDRVWGECVNSEMLVNDDRPVTHCGHTRIAILFSGGVDCMVLAALADRFVPADEAIDLLNVAFEQRKTQNIKNKTRGSGNTTQADPYDVPDRITGRNGLKDLNPNRKWNFVEINVTLEELRAVRRDHVHDLVYPLNTVLDDSIGCAIWCAARGRGSLNGEMYTSTARVVLVGMGADEQFAGYSRHRGRFGLEGWSGLIDEIDMEIKRISARNLGRDDRVISDHAREARFPYLDENVVSFLNSLSIADKTDLTLPRGIGEKLLLRLSACKLGLSGAAVLPKRAIQFGSRIAKAESRKEKASDICDRLTSNQDISTD